MFTLGFVMWHYNNQVVEVVVRYDNSPSCTNPPTTPPFLNNECDIVFDVPEDIPGPAFVYYRLTNFYQNHRRYVSSRSDSQLAGEGSGSVADCTPLVSVNGTKNNASLTYNPCGLVADSWFNDEFLNFRLSGGEAVPGWSESGIACPSDVARKFKRIPDDKIAQDPGIIGTPPPNLVQFVNPFSPNPQERYFNVTNEHFIVWMRVAGLPTFRKLYARIPGRQDLNGIAVPRGTYTMTVYNRYSTERFGGGTKSIVISNASFIGGKNPFLGYAFIAVGALCLALALAFFLVNLIKPRKLGDPALLSWNKENYQAAE